MSRYANKYSIRASMLKVKIILQRKFEFPPVVTSFSAKMCLVMDFLHTTLRNKTEIAILIGP